MKRVIRNHDIATEAESGVFRVRRDMIVTPMAQDFARNRGIRLEYEGDGPRGEAADEDRLVEAVVSRVAESLALEVASGQATRERRPAEGCERAVITATGQNKTGIVAAITSEIANMGVDIADISQTIVAGYFTMIVLADVDAAQVGSFRAFKERLEEVARRLGVGVMVMHEDLLASMHRI